MTTLACYGAEFEPLADLAGDFDVLSSTELGAWARRQWEELAEAMGWSAALEAGLARVRTAKLSRARVLSVAMAAFRGGAATNVEDGAMAERAHVRAAVLRELGKRANVWRVEVDAETLPSGACVGAAELGGDDELLSRFLSTTRALAAEPVRAPQRAFLKDDGPSYFWAPAPRSIAHRSACGWVMPLRLGLGAFPWVYGHRLQAPAPGLLWRSSGASVPTAEALKIAASLWQPAGNLRQDARVVADHYRHWRAATAGVLELAPSSATLERVGGCLYRRGELLEVCQGSEELVGLNGPRGFVSVAAFNFIQRRFAAFFAMRRSLLRARGQLPGVLQTILAGNPDPCLREQLNLGGLRARPVDHRFGI